MEVTVNCLLLFFQGWSGRETESSHSERYRLTKHCLSNIQSFIRLKIICMLHAVCIIKKKRFLIKPFPFSIKAGTVILQRMNSINRMLTTAYYAWCKSLKYILFWFQKQWNGPKIILVDLFWCFYLAPIPARLWFGEITISDSPLPGFSEYANCLIFILYVRSPLLLVTSGSGRDTGISDMAWTFLAYRHSKIIASPSKLNKWLSIISGSSENLMEKRTLFLSYHLLHQLPFLWLLRLAES